jgi:hypothetical protein
MTVRRRLPLPVLFVLAIAACGHSEPFAAPDSDLDGPLAPGEPARLTFGDGVGEPGWLPDGASIIYGGPRFGGDRLDRCLSVLPATGGTVRREICHPSIFDESIVDLFGSPDVSAGGLLVFHYVNAPGGGNPAFAGVFAAPLDAPVVTSAVRSVPFTGPDGLFYVGVSHLRWLGETEIVFVAYAQELVIPCAGCDAVVHTHPRTLFRAAAAPGSALTSVPGGAFATSVSAGATADEIYFTLTADTRIYHLRLSTGEQTVVHDFAGDGIARDVHFGAGRLTAVAGGRLQVVPSPVGPLQVADDGGHLFLLEPASGAVRRLTDDTRWFRHPAISPDGTRIVGEGHAVVISGPDTTVNPRADLWMHAAP